MANFVEANKKRNLSELSESSSASPVLQPDKSIKMSLDTSLTMSNPEVRPVDTMNQLFTQNRTLEEKNR